MLPKFKKAFFTGLLSLSLLTMLPGCAVNETGIGAADNSSPGVTSDSTFTEESAASADYQAADTELASEETSDPRIIVIDEPEPSELTISNAAALELTDEEVMELAEVFEVARPIVSASDAVNYEKIDLPSEINGCTVALGGFFDGCDDALQVFLRDGSTDKEIGKYSLSDGSYTTLFEYPDTREYALCAYNEDYLVMKIASDTWWIDADLYLYNVAEKSLEMIFEYSDDENGYTYYQNSNNIVLKDGKVYFDNFWQDNGELRVSLYVYDIAAGVTEKLLDDAQNPMSYGDDIIYFIKKNGEYKSISSLSGSYGCDVADSLTGIDVGDGIYSITAENVDDDATVWRLTPLNEENYIIKTAPYSIIYNIGANNSFVTFAYGFNNIPLMYDIETDSVIAFDDLYGWYGYYCGDYCAILFVSNNGEMNYYMVSPK